MGFLSVFSISVGTMVGAGIFVLPGMAAAMAGPGSIISFILSGVLALITAFCISEMATAIPKAGGTYVFMKRSLGSAVGSSVGIATWLGLLIKGSFAFVGFGGYLAALIAVNEIFLAVIASVLFILINIVGVKSSGGIQNLMLFFLTILLFLFIFLGMGHVELSQFVWVDTGVSETLATAGFVFVSYVGIAEASAIAEEVKDPGKNLPRAIIGSILFVILLYSLIMVVVVGAYPYEQLADSTTPILDVAEDFLGSLGVTVMVLAGVFATLSTGNASLMSSARYPFAMAKDGLMPDWLTKINKKFKTPVKAIVLSGFVLTVMLLIFPVQRLAEMTSALNILVFAFVNLSLIVLREAETDWYRPEFKAPLYPYLPAIGFFGSLGMLFSMGELMPIVFAFSVIILGLVWYYLVKDNVKDESEVRGAITQRKASKALDNFDEKTKDFEDYRVLVPITDIKHVENLIKIAMEIAEDKKGRIIPAIILEIPDQTPLYAYKNKYAKKREMLEEAVLNIIEENAEYDIMEEEVIVYTHSFKKTTVDLAEKEDADLILLEWLDEFSHSELLGSSVDYILHNAESDVAVFKDRGFNPTKHNKILLPTRLSSKIGLTLDLSSAIARKGNGFIELLRIINPRASSNEIEKIKEFQKRSEKRIKEESSSRIIKSKDVTKALINESRKFDLVVMSASQESALKGFLFGTIPNEVADKTDTSVLIVQEKKSRRPKTTTKIKIKISGILRWITRKIEY
ncbi:Amino acid transporter fused to UspA-like domain [Methanonatronarchaeum thermophilum]|uniref:Amino acid transporter fused to UspA-like domain n=1 Tax=Methanonatronarchaeum thermophilum TaxID=1927129 RepID=A0A1Y3GB49_9EURY|nr:amino acid permease [Methanonatronarchaeum thermophilum]OUJ18648.1 Amino acid transporter fused to UspA-like domain [Methanonatronarchaeum thermophilum]